MSSRPSGRGRRGPGGGRPTWWPENEPWPPQGGWPTERRRFIRRFALILALVVLVAIVASTVWNVISTQFAGQSPVMRSGSWVPAVVIVIVVASIGIRILRRTAAPIGDVMDAANRLAAGDYTARVEARGSGDVRRLIASFNQMAEQLQANEDQRRALLAEVAHELRTPLSVLHGDIEGMLDGVYPRDDAHLQPALDAARRMTRLLEDLQILSTAQAGALKLHPEPVAAGRLIDEVVAAFAPQAGARDIALAGDVGLVPEFSADPVRLRQVLDNLVNNALRFTPSGGSITVRCRAGEGRVVFAVTDTGPGIPPNQLAHLFERFSKSGDSKGSGLGLAIARRLVESHGGAIEAESGPGRGTTIRFWMPATGAAGAR